MTGRIGTFLFWWRDELLSFVPARVRALFRDESNLMYAALKDDRVALYRPTNDGFDHLGDIGLDGTTSGLPPQVLAAIGKNGATVALILPDDRLLRRGLTLPAAAEEDLHDAARYEMERRTPFTAADAYYDVAVRRRDATTGQIEADLFVAPRPLVDDTVARLTAAGLRPVRAGVADADDRPDPDINFLPSDRAGQRLAPGAFVAGLLGLIMLGFAAATFIVPVMQKKAQVAAISRDMERLRKTAREAADLRLEIEQLTGVRGALDRERSKSPAVTAVLDELTRRLPDNTWLNQLRINGDKMSIFGFTEAAPRLIEIIEGSSAFAEATFPTPVRPDPKTGKERFHIKFRIAGAPKR
jgi:general secretion pathway protein L